MKLVVDWDGTVTEEDTLNLVVRRFGDQAVSDRAEEQLQDGEISLKQCIERELESVRAPLEDVVSFLLAEARIRRGFAELAEAYRPLILSSSFEETIRPVLARERLEGLELLANGVDALPTGWQVRWRDDTLCSSCGQPCKRAALPSGPIVYVGDGYSDRCAALKADRVYARDGLARYLDNLSIAYEPFEDFLELRRALARA